MVTIVAGTGSSDSDNEGLVLIQVNRTQLYKHTQESIWAKSLGGDLYEIRRPLHLITGINSQDIVKAVILPGDSLPSVSEVVRRSGFRTLHLVFFKTVPTVDQEKILAEMTQWNAKFVRSLFDRFYTVEISPNGDFDAVCAYLKSLRDRELVNHEPDVNLDALLRFLFLG